MYVEVKIVISITLIFQKLSDEEIKALRTELAALKSALNILHDVMKMLETLEKGITGDSSKRKKRLSPAPLSTCEELSAALVFISNYDASDISETSEIYHQFESSPALLRAQSLQMYFSDFIDDSTGYTPCDGFKAQLTKTLVAVEKNVEKLMLMIPPGLYSPLIKPWNIIKIVFSNCQMF